MISLVRSKVAETTSNSWEHSPEKKDEKKLMSIFDEDLYILNQINFKFFWKHFFNPVVSLSDLWWVFCQSHCLFFRSLSILCQIFLQIFAKSLSKLLLKSFPKSLFNLIHIKLNFSILKMLNNGDNFSFILTRQSN